MNKKLVFYHILSSFLIVVFALSFSLMFPPIFIRFWQVLKEFGISCAYWLEQTLNNLFFIKVGWNIKAIINESNYIDGFSIGFLSESWDEFLYSFKVFFENFISLDFWLDYFPIVGNFGIALARILFFLIPACLVIYLTFKNYFSYSEEKAVGVVSRQLISWNKFSDKCLKVKFSVIDFFRFFKSKWYYKIVALILFAFFTNAITICFSFLGYYLYLSSSFDFVSLWQQVVRLYYDISFMFRPVYLPFWIWLFYVVIKKLLLAIANGRKERALNAAYNFVKNIMGLMTLIVGTMGRGKTKLMTYLSLVLESYFKQVALEKMKVISAYFPKEDYRLFESKFEEAFEKHLIYNLATTRKWLKETLSESLKEQTIFNGASQRSLYDIYFTYGQLYFIYFSPSSMIVSNYGVRSGLFEKDSIHLPEFVDDFMASDNTYYENSNFSHICDDNNYRLLKQVDNRLEWSKSLDIGIILKDEVGKDRKNQVESVDIKKDDATANQKNDGFNLALKLGRHPSTVDNFPFWRFLSADQRENSVPADFRELNDVIINIGRDSKKKNLFPFYSFIEWLINIPLKFLDVLFLKFRFNRDENTLLFQWIKDLTSKIYLFETYMENMYGCEVLNLVLANDKSEEVENVKFPLLFSAIYSSRYASDAYADIFNERGLESSYGLNDIPTFERERATVSEMKLTNQYYINEIFNIHETKDFVYSTTWSKKEKKKRRW